MENNKLLVLIVVVAIVAVSAVCLSSIFSINDARIVYYNFDSTETSYVEGSNMPTENDVLQFCKGKNIVTLSKGELMQSVNTNPQNSGWRAIGVVKYFPNLVEVHVVKTVVVAKVEIAGVDVYLDSFGYVCQPQDAEFTPVDITSVFGTRDVLQNQVGKPLIFASDANNKALDYTLQSFSALWQCKLEMEEIPSVIGQGNVFSMDSYGNFVVSTRVGAKIVVQQPDQEFQSRLIKALSVYFNETLDMQKDGVVITVLGDGTIITPKN